MNEPLIVAGMTLSQSALAIAEHLPAYYAEERERRTMSEMLIQHITGLSQTSYLIDRKVRQLSDIEACWLDQALARLVLDEPIQYIIGKSPFGPVELTVGSGVLIPRPETAELCNLIVSRHRDADRPLHLLDVGSGSACIPIYIGSYCPLWRLYGVDLSEQALSYAEQNVRSSGIEVKLFCGDLFRWCQGAEIPTTLAPIDILVSNPPYIPDCERSSIRPNVVVSEPSEALFVPDDDPLRYYKALIALVPHIRSSVRSLEFYCETHNQLADQVAALCLQGGGSSVDILHDLSGHPRFVHTTFR